MTSLATRGSLGCRQAPGVPSPYAAPRCCAREARPQSRPGRPACHRGGSRDRGLGEGPGRRRRPAPTDDGARRHRVGEAAVLPRPRGGGRLRPPRPAGAGRHRRVARARHPGRPRRYDFAFPAGERIRRERKVTAFYQPFYTPMAVGTFKPIAKLLARAGVASPLADGYWRFDMRRYLDLVARKTRWNELPGNTVYPARKCRRERQQPPADPPAPHVPARRQHQEKLVRALPIAPHGERARTRRVRRGEGGELLRLQTHAGTLPTPDLHRWTLLARLRLAHASCVYRRLQRGRERCRHGQRGTTGTGAFARPAAPPRDRPCSWPAARKVAPLVRTIATEDHAGASERKPAGCWLSPGWSSPLRVSRLAHDGRKDGTAGGLGPRTIRRLHLCLHQALGYAMKVARPAGNPATDAEPPAVPAHTPATSPPSRSASCSPPPRVTGGRGCAPLRSWRRRPAPAPASCAAWNGTTWIWTTAPCGSARRCPASTSSLRPAGRVPTVAVASCWSLARSRPPPARPR
jgi:hypothetical protein